MKKLLVALLLACMVFSVIASADETTYATEGVYARFDFGKNSKTNKDKKTSDGVAYDDALRALLEDEGSYTHFENLKIESTDDTWIITALVDGATEARVGDVYPGNCFAGDEDKIIPVANDMGLDFYDLYDEDGVFGTVYAGYGTWNGYPYTTTNFFKEGQWKGMTQYMKFKLKNNSDNGRISFRFNDTGAYYTTTVAGFNISVNDEDFKTYLVDIVNIATVYSGKEWNETMQPGNNWTWQTGKELAAISFYFLSSFCMYDRGTPDNFTDPSTVKSAGFARNFKADEGDGPSAQIAQLWYANCRPWSAGLDTQLAVKAGASVEVDYVIFASSAEEASCYTSYLDEQTETTGYLKYLEQRANALGLTFDPAMAATEESDTQTDAPDTGSSGTTPIITGTSSIVIALSIMALAAVAAIVIAKKKAR